MALHVQGDGGWREFDDWPPPATPTDWYLHPDGRLATEAPDRRVGARPLPLRPRGPDAVDRRHRHAHRRRDRQPRRSRRATDVLVFTSDALAERTRARRTGVGDGARDVDARPRRLVRARVRRAPRRRVVNVCDGAAAVHPETIERDADGVFAAARRPVAHRAPLRRRAPPPRPGLERIAPGVRTQPRARASRTTTAVDMRVADVAVHHDPDHPSGVTLPHLEG